jgi:hypothetical protein
MDEPRRRKLGKKPWGCRSIQSAALSIAIAILVAANVIPCRTVFAQDDNVDQASSQALTSYFKENRLPLVGAQVMKASGGARRVVLYGFVATDEGKQDAERKAIAFLGAPAATIDDRLVIKPELATMTGPQAEPQDQGTGYQEQETGASGTGGLSFDQIYQQIQQYGIKNPPGE